MDNNNPQVLQGENQTPRGGGFRKLLTRKNIFLVLGLVLAAEVVWALWTLVISPTRIQTQPPALVSQKPKTTSISLTSPTANVKAGDTVVVNINIDSDKLTDGTDLIINYNPQLLEVQNTDNQQPVAVGTLYDDYPFNSLDKKEGKITVSGISTKQNGTKADGVFGTVTFKALKEGTTRVSLLFNVSDTTDSNVIETGTGKDVLEQVNNLELKILP